MKIARRKVQAEWWVGVFPVVAGDFVFLYGAEAQRGYGLLILEVSKSHTTTHHSR